MTKCLDIYQNPADFIEVFGRFFDTFTICTTNIFDGFIGTYRAKIFDATLFFDENENLVKASVIFFGVKVPLKFYLVTEEKENSKNTYRLKHTFWINNFGPENQSDLSKFSCILFWI